MATSARKVETDSQVDFRGGANGVTHPSLLRPSESQRLQNAFGLPGGGLEARKGFKHYGTDTNRGTAIFEFEQSVGTVLTYQDIGANWWDETMQPYFTIFPQVPQVNDAVYFGAREKFGQIILYVPDLGVSPPAAGNTFIHEFWNGAAWTDETAAIVESVANSKQMRGVVGEWVFTYPDQSTWAPNQVETRTYQFWRRIRCTLGGTNFGTAITQSRRHVRGDWVGRRHLLTGFIQGITEWPGITLTGRNVDIYNQITGRIRTAAINDYLYIASDGQKPLRRWNGSRAASRSGASQAVANAGLTAPTVAPVLTPAANANAYPLAYTLGYCISFEYGPESKLGESRPSPVVYQAPQGANYQVSVGLAAAIAQAATLDVNAIRIYATYDITPKLVSERGSLANYLLIKRVERTDASWLAGAYVDAFTERVKIGQRNPITYDNAPPFYPKYIAFGAERIWIANDRFVAWSDIARGDSWDPANIKAFPAVRGIHYWADRLLVFQERDISQIQGVNKGLPDIGYFWRGVGLAQPDTIAVGEGQLHFVSPIGPARIVGEQVELTGRARAWEDSLFWASGAPAREIASAAYHDGRFWFGIDRSGAGPGLYGMASYDIRSPGSEGWSRLTYDAAVFGTLASVHCPLDHAEARKRLLMGFPDDNFDAVERRLTILEYGDTDHWTTNTYDGALITTTARFREASMGAADRVKEYIEAHVKIRNQMAVGGGGLGTTTVKMVGSGGETNSTTLTLAAGAVGVDQEFRFSPTDSGGGKHRGHASSLEVIADSDGGFRLTSWLLRAALDEWRPGP